jgi:hypothetical protein
LQKDYVYLDDTIEKANVLFGGNIAPSCIVLMTKPRNDKYDYNEEIQENSKKEI